MFQFTQLEEKAQNKDENDIQDQVPNKIEVTDKKRKFYHSHTIEPTDAEAVAKELNMVKE